jgi:hypothetical protein
MGGAAGVGEADLAAGGEGAVGLAGENFNVQWPYLARLKWPTPLVVCR